LNTTSFESANARRGLDAQRLYIKVLWIPTLVDPIKPLIFWYISGKTRHTQAVLSMFSYAEKSRLVLVIAMVT
jgi:hypothetical protein